MKILVIGSGGREHALIWKLKQSAKVSQVYCAPGNAGISRIASCLEINLENIPALVDFARKEKIDFTIVGPELPLAEGIVNDFIQEGLKIIGPTREAAEIESSKVFAKYLMKKYNLPTANYAAFNDLEKALIFLRDQNFPLVIKADGLAAGKGVFIVENWLQASEVLNSLMKQKKFGHAGNQVVIEEFLRGEEVSILSFCDGKTVVPMVSSQDYKKIEENDQGLNTGGMGAYSPCPFYNEKLNQIVLEKILKPILRGLKEEGREYKGILYAGIILTKDGPKVLEFNARFGDPETQVVLPRLKTDLMDIFEAIIEGNLDRIKIEWKENATVCVVVASKGYPEKYFTGEAIAGLEKLDGMNNLMVFHAGTKLQEDKVVTAGGRVLGVAAWDESIFKARNRVYEGIKEVNFRNMYYRKDIALKAIL